MIRILKLGFYLCIYNRILYIFFLNNKVSLSNTTRYPYFSSQEPENNPHVQVTVFKAMFLNYMKTFTTPSFTAISKRGLDTISPAMSLRRLQGVPYRISHGDIFATSHRDVLSRLPKQDILETFSRRFEKSSLRRLKGSFLPTEFM